MSGNQQNGAQRIRYFDGQLLTARDLQDDVAYEARMRGLHVRALHNTWGVALGFEVTVQKGVIVKVSPGIAYDCHGREIFAARDLLVGPPPPPASSQGNAWLFDLVIRYDERGPGRRDGGLVCLGGVNPDEERPLWRWRFAGEADDLAGAPTPAPEPIRLGEEIPLARFLIQPAAPQIGAPDFSVRRNAQGLVRPHIAGDQIQQQLQHPPNSAELSYTLEVDTTTAGFNQTPFYFARVTIPYLLDLAQQGGDDAEILRHLLGPFVSIRSAARQSFVLDVRFALSTPRFGVPWKQLYAVVTWVGLEPTNGCTPSALAQPYLLFYFPLLAGTTSFDTAFLLNILA